MDLRQTSKRQLKRKLEALDRKGAHPLNAKIANPSASRLELQQLVHELQTHQIELEMQNRQLRETQAELERSRKEYAELYDFAPVGYIDLDQQGVVRRINLTGAELLQRERNGIIGKPFSLFLDSADSKRFFDHLRQAWKTRQRQIMEVEMRAGKRSIPVQVATIAAEPGEKQQRLCRSILVDITESRQAAQNQRDSEARLRIALEAARMETWEWNIASDRLNWSAQYLQLLPAEKGRPPSNYEEFANRVHPEDRGLFRKEMQLAISDGGDCHFEFRTIWPDHSLHWIQAEGHVFTDPASGRPIRMMGVMMDTTVRKQTEAQLQSTHEALEQRVEERTAELARAITALKKEVLERKQAQEGRQQLFRELAIAQEEERRRISRELHDQMGQHLTAIILGLKSLEPPFKGHPEIERLRDLQKLTDDIGRQVHRIAFELRPTALDDLGLHSTLLNYMEEWSARYGISVDFHTAGLEKERLPSEIETTVYRIAQEALNNVVKHAQATRLSLILLRKADHLLAIIEDDGKGFDVETANSRGSGPQRLGLLGIKERIALAGGSFQIESSPGVGATLFIKIPLPQWTQETSL